MNGSARRRGWPIAVLVRRPWRALLILLGCVGLLFIGLVLILDWDRLRIAAERWRRLAYAAAGASLPGTPDLDAFDRQLAALGVEPGAPVFTRIFKLEFELEPRKAWCSAVTHGGQGSGAT